MEQPSPARLYAALLGAALVAFGILGFFYSASFGSPGDVSDVFGVFAVNGWENVFSILLGVTGVLVAGFASRAYALWVGGLLIAVAAYGFVVGNGGAILGFLPANTADDLLRVALGGLGLAAALASPSRRAATT